MELLEYQKNEGLTWRALAERVGVPHSNLNALAYGKRECSMATARQIEDATGGKVTVGDIARVRRHYLAQSARGGKESRRAEAGA